VAHMVLRQPGMVTIWSPVAAQSFCGLHGPPDRECPRALAIIAAVSSMDSPPTPFRLSELAVNAIATTALPSTIVSIRRGTLPGGFTVISRRQRVRRSATLRAPSSWRRTPEAGQWSGVHTLARCESNRVFGQAARRTHADLRRSAPARALSHRRSTAPMRCHRRPGNDRQDHHGYRPPAAGAADPPCADPAEDRSVGHDGGPAARSAIPLAAG
jgi:hypothetical protein